MTHADFKRLIMDSSDIMWQVAVSMMRSSTDAQDVIADTIEKLWQARGKLKKAENQTGYVVTTLRRTALDALRRRSRKGLVSLDEVPTLTIDRIRNPEESMEEEGELDLVKKMIATLSDNQRRVVELTAFNGLDNSEVAELTGLSLDNVRVLLSRARSKLRIMYRKYNS